MSYSNICILVIFHFIFLFTRFLEAQDKEPQISLTLNEWQIIDEGWPIEDYFDRVNERRGQFYYNNTNDVLTDITFKLKTSLLDQIKDKEYKLYRISFKLWLHNRFVVYIKLDDQSKDNYIEKFEGQISIGHWLSRSYVLNFNEFEKFQILFEGFKVDSYRVLAIKDFKIEFQTQTNPAKIVAQIADNTGEGFKLNNWTHYMTPPADETQESSPSFIYCTDNCELTFESTQANIKEAKISFKYWASGPDAKISISTDPALKTIKINDKWLQYPEQTISSNKLDRLKINIKTEKGSPYAAIKDLTVVLVYNDTTKVNTQVCDSEKCPLWKFSETTFWGQTDSLLEPSTEYYVPRASENSLVIEKEEKLNETNVCLNIEYILSKEKEIKLNINYKLKGEDKSQTILEIRPKIGYKKSIKLCLRQLIATNAGKYEISLNSEQTNYENIANNLHINISEIKDPDENGTKWPFSETTQNYLLTSDISEPNIKFSSQWIDLKSDEDPDYNFEFSNNPIIFTAKTKSKIPTSEYLSSIWIKNDRKLHLKEQKFKITITDSKQLNKFTLRPMVCDWLSHCNDVLTTPKTFTLETTQDFSFKFLDTELENSDYLRLVFKVEYFKPIDSVDEIEEQVHFNITLVHFGDPCVEDDSVLCNGHGKCIDDPKTSAPNDPKCKCDEEFDDGQSCSGKNSCFKEYQGESFISKCGALRCEKLADKFRCICNKNESIIWNGTECKDITPDLLNWTAITNNGGYYPNNSSNSLELKISNINSTAYDVCLTLSYTSSKTVELKLNYTTIEGKPTQIANIPLLQTTEQDELDFCLADFYLNEQENFKLSLSIIATFEKWDETTFLLKSFKPSLAKKREPVEFLYRWDQEGDKPAFNQTWITIPDSLFEITGDVHEIKNIKFSVTAKDPTLPTKAYLISDWIKNGSNFAKTENFYSIQYTKDPVKNFKLRQGYIYVENNQSVTNYEDVGHSVVGIKENIVIRVPQEKDYSFKIIFEIEILNKQEEWFLTLKNLSLGDPCIIYNKGSSVCENNGQCSGKTPTNYTCDCTGTAYDGPNCQFNNLCNNTYAKNTKQTNEVFCSFMPSLPNSPERKCKVLSNNEFECICPENDYFWESSAKRCLRNGYTTQKFECLGKDCQIFDDISEKLKLSHRNLPVLTKIDDPTLPFHYSSTKDTKLTLNVKGLASKTDVCFDLRYLISKNSKLGISYESLDSLSLTSTQTTNDTINWFPSEKGSETLCASILTKNIGSDFKINFNADVNDPDTDIIALKLMNNETSKLNDKLKTELSYLTHWSKTGDDINYKVNNQWPIMYPSTFWNVPNPDKSDIIEFSYPGTGTPQTAYLWSNWINKAIDSYKLRFKFNKNSENKFKLNITTINENMETAVINTTEGEGYYNIPVDKMDTHFRIGFAIELKYSESIQFSIESIDLGDPCVYDNTTYNICSGQGQCLRVEQDSTLTYTCNCNQTYTGINCEAKNYCKLKHEILANSVNMTGDEYCKREGVGGLNCTNSYPDKFGKFICGCDHEFYWNFNKLKCTNNPKCLTKGCDEKTQVCKEPGSDETDAKCECKVGLVNLGKGDSLDCQKLDPCNEDHRKILGFKRKACEHTFAICKAYGNTTDDYMCICKEGFKTVKNSDKTKTSCEMISCSFPTLNGCDQYCIPNISQGDYKCDCTNNLYELDVDGKSCNKKINVTLCECNNDTRAFCDKNKKCTCPYGYTWKELDDGAFHCHPDVSLDFSKICPNGINKANEEELSCSCKNGFVLDESTKTCKLEPICGEYGKGKTDCDKKNALCKLNQSELGYTCVCPIGKQKHTNGTCIDSCEIQFDNEITRNKACQKIQGQCNPLRFENETIEDYQTVYTFCECGPGYTWNETGTECLIVEKVSLFSLKFKNTFIHNINSEDPIPTDINEVYYYDLNAFIEDLKFSNHQNQDILENNYKPLRENGLVRFLKDQLEPVLDLLSEKGTKWSSFDVKDCKLEDEYYECFITINDKKTSDDQLIIKLSQVCVNITNHPDQCFFLKNEKSLFTITSSNEGSDVSLVLNRDELKKIETKTYDNCDSKTDVCGQYTYTHCKTEQNSSLYSCLCNEQSIISEKNVTLSVSPSSAGEALAFICKVNQELCATTCPKDIFNCTQSMPYLNSTGIWVAPVSCRCNAEHLPDNDNTKCVSICDGAQCNHGQCSPSGTDGNACVCEPGWYGPDCNSEFEPSLGGWIAGTTVLAVICIALIGVAFVFAKRSRHSRLTNENNNAEQAMSQYSPTSYRVGHNQYNNEGFNRD